MKQVFSTITILSLIIPGMARAMVDTKQLLLMSNGVVGSTVITKCSSWYTQPSMVMYMAASVAYVGKEIFGGQTDSANMEVDFANFQAGNGANVQRMALESQITNLRRVADRARSKKNFAIALTAAYGVSAGFAVAEQLGMIAGKSDYSGCRSDASHGPVVEALGLAFQVGPGVAQALRSGSIVGAGLSVGGALLSNRMGWANRVLLPASEVQNKGMGLLNNGAARAVIFSAFAALNGLVASEIARDERTANDQIADLQRTLESLEELREDGGLDGNAAGGEQGGAPGVVSLKGRNFALRPLPTPPPVAPQCLGATSSSVSFSPGNCSNPTQLRAPSLSPQFEVPTLRDGALIATNLANAAARGDFARANVEAGNLAGLAGRISDVNSKLQKKLNEKLKAQGKPTIDFEAEIKKELASRLAAVSEASGTPTVPALALDGSTSKSNEEKKSEEAGINEVKSAGAATAPAAIEGLGFSEDGSFTENPAEAPSMADRLGEFESTESDISKQSDVSIFKQLSHRYILNYSRFFVEKKAPKEEAPLQ